jgi:GH24 family phage-related lysozyme (muramidase)
LVFNRGTKLTGDSRIEMRNIKTLIPLKKYKEIASEIKKMKRLWRGKNLDGLLERRDAEAKMVEDCV